MPTSSHIVRSTSWPKRFGLTALSQAIFGPREVAPPPVPSADELHKAVEAARALLLDAEGEKAAYPDYPVNALGALAAACRVISTEGQLDPAMAGQTLLLTANLLTVGHFNVKTLAGTKTIALYGIVQALSGEGKTTAESVALRAVYEWEKAGGADGKPRRLLVRDATIQALMRDLAKSDGVLGLFSSEGGTFSGGHSMKAENKLATAASLNLLWDENLLSYSRVTGGEAVHKHGCNLSVSLMLQPVAAAQLLTDADLAATGFPPRVLLALPRPTPPRKAREFAPECHPIIQQFLARCVTLIEKPLPASEADKTVLALAPDAREAVREAFEYFEHEAKLGGMNDIRPFALKATEQLCRVAGVLAAFAGRPAVTLEDAIGARKLVDYSLACWQRTISQAPAVHDRAAAFKLVEFLGSQDGGTYEESLINKNGPSALRTAAARQSAVGLLLSMGLVDRQGSKVRLATRS